MGNALFLNFLCFLCFLCLKLQVWTDEGIFFCGPIKTGLNFTPLLPNCTIKVDFELADAKHFFMSPTATDLKISFENAILKIPKYSLETSLYDALIHKMVDRPLKLCWNTNDVLVYTIGNLTFKKAFQHSLLNFFIRFRRDSRYHQPALQTNKNFCWTFR